MGLDTAALELVEAEESIEHLGRISTFTLDLEARWQAESGARRLDVDDADLILDIDSIVAAEPAVVWAHLTSPALRMRWEGPMTIIDETLAGGRRGVGTLSQCVTGQLATLEEIVDWQPYDHVGWRLAVPGVGPVAAVPTSSRSRAGRGYGCAGSTRERCRSTGRRSSAPSRARGRIRAFRPGRRRRDAGHGPKEVAS